MAHETEIIVTITAALLVASVGGYLAARLHLPAILGFVVSGIVIGPFSPGYTADSEIASQLAEIGVILLMFGVGVHFSLKDLLAVQRIALPAAIVQTVLMTALVTVIVHQIWGWSIGAGVVLGLAVAIASTVILVHSLTERNELDSTPGRIAIGWLIVEDLITVLALVLLPEVIGPDSGGSGAELALAVAITLAKVTALAVVAVVVGARVVPWMLLKVAHTGSRELFTLSVLAAALGIAWASAALFDVSLALGAFLAGLIISESDLSHRAAADALPLRDAFAVLFFVSVGMLFDWHILLEQPWLLATLLLIILLVKPLITFIIVALYRYPTRFGLLIAASRAQIGEFSFILGALGLSLAVFDEDANSLLLAAAILSIALNPLAYEAIGPLERRLRSTRLTRALTEGRAVSVLDQLGAPEPLRGHAIVCGHGRVGEVICRALERRSFEYVVVEQNRRIVDQLRERGVRVVYGDAANPIIMEQLGLARARVLIVAMPEPITARIVVERAAELAPRVPVVVRTHSEGEREWFERHSIGEAVVGELELALEMTRYALRRFGVRSIEIQAIVQGLRTTSGSQARDADWE